MDNIKLDNKLMENKKEKKIITMKMEIFKRNIFIKMENQKENKLHTIKLEIFKRNIVKMENNK